LVRKNLGRLDVNFSPVSNGANTFAQLLKLLVGLRHGVLPGGGQGAAREIVDEPPPEDELRPQFRRSQYALSMLYFVKKVAMPTKKTIDVYRFDELAPKVKTRVIEKFRPQMWDSSDSESLNEWFADRLDEVGLPSKKIGWSLSNSQGDGVAFYGRIDLREYLEKNKLKSKYAELFQDDFSSYVELSIDKVGPHMYDHWNTMRVEWDTRTDPTPKQKQLLNDLQEHIREQTKDLSREFEKAGYADIENKTGDEAIEEFLEANDYEFKENGDQA
jgi:hypothetical protein